MFGNTTHFFISHIASADGEPRHRPLPAEGWLGACLAFATQLACVCTPPKAVVSATVMYKVKRRRPSGLVGSQRQGGGSKSCNDSTGGGAPPHQTGKAGARVCSQHMSCCGILCLNLKGFGELVHVPCLTVSRAGTTVMGCRTKVPWLQ